MECNTSTTGCSERRESQRELPGFDADDVPPAAGKALGPMRRLGMMQSKCGHAGMRARYLTALPQLQWPIRSVPVPFVVRVACIFSAFTLHPN
jgi:hypothetical protein